MISKNILFTGLTCIDFYYHMYGRTMGTLNVFIGDNKVFSISGNQGNKWKKAHAIVYKRKILPVSIVSSTPRCFGNR